MVSGYSLPAGEMLKLYTRFTLPVNHVAFSSSGGFVAAAGEYVHMLHSEGTLLMFSCLVPGLLLQEVAHCYTLEKQLFV